MKANLKLPPNQSGYASFVIALVTVVVISLIVAAFAADSRIEQKNSLASNLSTQAYYAAESGINDAKTVIGNNAPTPTNGCANPGTSYSGLTYIQSGSPPTNVINGTANNLSGVRYIAL